MTSYLSNEELQAMREEINNTSDSVSCITFGTEQARKLLNEVLVSRGLRTTSNKSTGINQIDLFDTSNLY